MKKLCINLLELHAHYRHRILQFVISYFLEKNGYRATRRRPIDAEDYLEQLTFQLENQRYLIFEALLLDWTHSRSTLLETHLLANSLLAPGDKHSVPIRYSFHSGTTNSAVLPPELNNPLLNDQSLINQQDISQIPPSQQQQQQQQQQQHQESSAGLGSAARLKVSYQSNLHTYVRSVCNQGDSVNSYIDQRLQESKNIVYRMNLPRSVIKKMDQNSIKSQFLIFNLVPLDSITSLDNQRCINVRCNKTFYFVLYDHE